MKATVYRLLDAEGHPLYIGCSLNVLVRVQTHERERLWWAEVATITCEHFEDHKAALTREAELIAAECPRENVHGLPGGETALRVKARREEAKREREEYRNTDAYRDAHMYRVPGGFSCTNCGRTAEWAPKGAQVSERPCKACGVKALVAGVELRPVAIDKAAA